MPITTALQLAELQCNPENIRNICILAHVDHGKTTLADNLLASNGIISHRMAGKLRYMDSREDEQLRGITMKSSAISLLYKEGDKDFLINLIDSPGHVDFSSEVSTAVRLCDGAIVMIDVVEGVCPQTHVVLRQAWLENIKPVVVLNKIDRLILELKLTPLEAHLHMQQVLEKVNAVTAELYTSEIYDKSAKTMEPNGSQTADESKPDVDQVYDWSVGLEDTDDSHLYFSPDQGNVIFACAIDGWGFGIKHFAELFANKLGIKSSILQHTLWGDFYLNSKTKRIMKGAQAKGKKPLFVQFVLENLWSVYEAVDKKDEEKIQRIVKSLNLTVHARDLKMSDPKSCIQAICRQWLPLSTAVLGMVVNNLPSPLQVVDERIDKLLSSRGRSLQSLPPETQKLKQDFLACRADEQAPVIVFVSKMVAVDRKILPRVKQKPLTREELESRHIMAKQRHIERMAKKEQESQDENLDIKASAQVSENSSENFSTHKSEDEDDHVFIAFARVFSGMVKKGQSLYVLGPKHDPVKALQEVSADGVINTDFTLDDLSSNRHITKFTVDNIYMMMGRDLEELEQVPAGNVLGIGGLEKHVLKSATLSNTVACPAFTAMFFEAEPIVRVAVEPKYAADLGKLISGMKLLNQADPCVEVLHTETGEHVIVAAGEMHLQRCLDDLQKRYAKVEINVSPTIVPFRETIVKPPTIDRANEEIGSQGGHKTENEDEEIIERGLVQIQTSNKLCSLRIRCLALPSGVTSLLDKNLNLLYTLDHYNHLKEKGKHNQLFELSEENIRCIQELKEKLTIEFKSAGSKWKNAVNQIWAFGPRRCGPNILLNRLQGYKQRSVWSYLESPDICDKTKMDFDGCIVGGFQLATLNGPMCEEPMMGVCYIIEQWDIVESISEITNKSTNKNTESELLDEKEEVKDAVPTDLVSEFSSLKIGRRKRNSSTLSSLDGESSSSSSDDESELQVPRQITYGPLSGQIMSCVRYGCRKAFQTQPQRLMTAMFKCSIQATSDVLGKLYAVLGKRFGRVLHEDLRDGSHLFDIEAVLPVVESFGFTEEFRKKTSGLANPQLKFSHWEVIDLDPYWVPTTEEEILLYGEKADYENYARKYKNSVRIRKGLKVDEQIVVHAEKQRTLTRNK